MIPGAFPIIASGVPAPKLTYVGTTANTSGSSFANIPIGDAHPTRAIIVCLGVAWDPGSPGFVFTGITVGGITGSLVIDKAQGSFARSYVFITSVPTGTTATVSFTGSTRPNRCNIFSVYAVNYLRSTIAVATDVAGVGASNASISLDVPVNGIAVASAMNAQTGTTGYPSGGWSGANLDNNTIFGSGLLSRIFTCCAGSFASPVAIVGHGISTTNMSSGESTALCGASFR